MFGLYAHTIMRGLHSTDDRTFVTAFQAIDRAIINPVFLLTFFGALAASGIAGVLYLRDDDRSVLPWIVAAFGFCLVVVVITMAVHVPLNDDIKAAENPQRIADLDAVRDAFHETRGSPGTSCANTTLVSGRTERPVATWTAHWNWPSAPTRPAGLWMSPRRPDTGLKRLGLTLGGSGLAGGGVPLRGRHIAGR